VVTGLYPPLHGVRAHYQTKLSPGARTIAEAFRKQGYETVMSTDKPEFFTPLGLERGFKHLFAKDDLGLFEFLNRNKELDIFLFVHFFDVHSPYMFSEGPPTETSNGDYFSQMKKLYKDFGLDGPPSNPYEAWNRLGKNINYDIDVMFPFYVKGVSKFDRGRFGAFINRLRSVIDLDGSLLVIFSDHGEGTCSQGSKMFQHAGDLFDDVLRVPLIVSHPDLTHKVSDKLTSTVDIFPTVLELCNIPVESVIDGQIIDSGRETTYSETWLSQKDSPYLREGEDSLLQFHDIPWLLRQRCIRTDSAKYIICGHEEKWLEDVLRKPTSPLYSKLYRNVHPYIRKFLPFPPTGSDAAEDIFKLEGEEFVRELYRRVLSRFEDPGGLSHYANLLGSGYNTKEEILLGFSTKKEFRDTPKYIVYDLAKDPSEKNPINPLLDNKSAERVRFHYDIIADLEKNAVQTEGIWDEASEPDFARGEAPATESLAEKERESIGIIKKAVELYGKEHIGVAWTGGKDSTTVLHLVQQAFGGEIPVIVVNIDTSVKFPEIYEFREHLKREWGLDLRLFRNDEALKWIKPAEDHSECCYQLKTLPLRTAIRSLGLKALITGVRWDEQETRSNEEYFSQRFNTEHVRVQPILHFTEADIWEHLRKHNIPYCKLYDRGFRSLGCLPCTTPATKDGPERTGRSLDKETVMAKLREMGYF
jgi:phosphoadenosine phosphosulfate reductase